jgi:general secretion pathway protein A
MYKSFYGLRERPFDLTPNPGYLFLSNRQREALSTLRYALQGPRGLMLMIGEAGTGKTTLVHTALSELGSGDTQCALLSNPTLTRNEFYEFLANALDLPGEASRSKARFLLDLRDYVSHRHADGKLTAILFDEAQSLPPELLEEIRLLSNIETPTTKFLTVVLAGQPELADRLNEPQFRQLKQRIGLRCELAAFDLPESAAYVAGRIRIAGGTPAEIFTRNAVEAIFEGSGGVPRLINVVCHNSLIGGFATETKPIPRKLVEEVLRDFDLTDNLNGPDNQTDARSSDEHLDARRRAFAEVQSAASASPVSATAPDQSTSDSKEQRPSSALLGAFGRKRRQSFF